MESKEFQDFSKTGLASKVNNLQNVYAMYLNYLVRSEKVPAVAKPVQQTP